MIPTTLSEIVAKERRSDFQEAARTARLARCARARGLRALLLRRFGGSPSAVGAAPDASVTIHLARAEDMPALRRLAALDSAPLPESPLLVGEVEGEPRAALGLRSLRSVADPFKASAWLVSLLALRAAQLWPQPPVQQGAGHGEAAAHTRAAPSRRRLRAV